jgi:type I site-specific restriction endonuclease
MTSGKIRTLVLFSVVALAAACGKRAEISSAQSTNAPSVSDVEKLKQNAKGVVTTTTAYLIEQKDQLQKSLSGKMTEFDKQMSELKAKSAKAGEQAKSEWTSILADLQKKKQAAADKLEQLKHSNTDRWQDFKAGVDAAFADLENSLKEAFARSKDTEPSERQ